MDIDSELPLADDEAHAALYELLVDALEVEAAAARPEPRSDDENG